MRVFFFFWVPNFRSLYLSDYCIHFYSNVQRSCGIQVNLLSFQFLLGCLQCSLFGPYIGLRALSGRACSRFQFRRSYCILGDMHILSRIITRLSSASLGTNARYLNEVASVGKDGFRVMPKNGITHLQLINCRLYSGRVSGDGGNDGGDDWGSAAAGAPFGGASSEDFDFGSASSWSTGLTKEHFDGQAIGQQVTPAAGGDSKVAQYSHELILSEFDTKLAELEAENKKSKTFVDGWGQRMREMSVLLKQVREPGARGSYLKDSEKAEMYRLHKENPEVYTVEKLAKDYRIMRQRVHAILWLKELEEEEEKKLGHPLDDSVELLLDTCPEFFNSHDREFHVASLPYKPEFKVMPEGWDGTTRDLDEVHYEISMKEDEMLYQEFVQKMNFNKKKMAGEIKCHKYSRRRSEDGWKLTVEKLGPRGKRGNSGGWKFVSLPDGSSRPLNELEKMFVKRETPRRRRKILP